MDTQQTSMAAVQGMTAAQRLHMEVFGYVIIENFISPEHVERLRAMLYECEARSRRGEPLPGNLHVPEKKDDYFRVDHVSHADPSFYQYVSHPRLVKMAEEAIGYRVRLLHSDAHIRRSGSSTFRYYFHRDNRKDLAYTSNGLYHHPFIKALTVLTDVGPDDGGTCIIPGSHKTSLDLNEDDVIAAAIQDESHLIHQMVAPAGSTVIFYESLLHTSGINRSGKDRPLIIAGYVPSFEPSGEGCVSPSWFTESLSERERPLFMGEPRNEETTQLRAMTFPGRQPVRPIAPPAQAPRDPWIEYHGIRIVRATFGDGTKTVDVMHLVRRIADGEKLLISFLTAGDPAPLVIKTIKLTWVSQDGETHERSYVEGHVIHLDELLGQGAIASSQ